MHDSISSPLQQQCLTPISGHFEQGFFIANSNEASNYAAPPPEVDKHKTMEQQMFRFHHIHNDFIPNDIAQAIWTGKAIIGTNRSVLNDNATYGISILIQQEDKEQPKIAISIGGKLPHLAKFTDMDSHQPEAAALFAALVLVCRLLTENPIDPESQPAKSVRYFLDNKSVIDDLEWPFDEQTSVFDYLKADFDILHGINIERDTAPLAPRILWVKGHQDDHMPLKELPDAALANYYTDQICGIIHEHPIHDTGLFPEWMPNLDAGLLHQGQLVTKKQESHIITTTTAPGLQQAIIKDSQKRDPLIIEPWTNVTFNSVDWQANQSSFSALAPGQKIQISKYAHEWTPTMHKRAQAEGNKIDCRCFACGNLKETVNHMLQCKSDQGVAARAKALQEFRKHLSRYHTPAPMANMIVTSLKDWYNKK
jgi:hypothetical protein